MKLLQKINEYLKIEEQQEIPLKNMIIKKNPIPIKSQIVTHAA